MAGKDTALQLKLITESDTKLIELEFIEFQEFGYDLISDESYTLSTRNTQDIKIGDMVILSYHFEDYLFYIDKVIKNEEVTIKSPLEAFNQNIYITDFKQDLRTFLTNYFINIPMDQLRAVNWLDVSLVDTQFPIVLKDDSSTTSTEDVQHVYNAKDVIIDTIFSRRYNLDFINDMNNNKFKLKMQPQKEVFEINVDIPAFLDVQLPQIDKKINTLDIYSTETTDITTKDSDGNDQTEEKVVGTTIHSYCLLKDNTVSINLSSSNRILPPWQDITEVTWKNNEKDDDGNIIDGTPDYQQLAEDKLIDDSQYFATLELPYYSELYDASTYSLGDTVDLFHNGIQYRSLLTGITINQASTTLKFGRDRIDLIFDLNKK